MTADEIIAALDLQPHREGGFYRETFRDYPGPDGRAHSTAIYYLLKAGEVSRWHRIDVAEVWHCTRAILWSFRLSLRSDHSHPAGSKAERRPTPAGHRAGPS